MSRLLARTWLPACAVLALNLLPASGSLAQYRWVDGDGRVHYGDAPPRDARDVRSMNLRSTAQPADETSNLAFELRRAVERYPVTLYTAPDCAPCNLARDYLRARGVPHAEKTVTTPDEIAELQRLSGGLRLPYLRVGAQAQSAFEPTAWGATLDAAGYPRGSMLPRSYQWPSAQALIQPPPEKAKQQAAAPAANPAPAATQ